jgi:hypothetical protein
MNVHVDCSKARERMRARARAFRDVTREPLEMAAMTAANAARATTSWKDQSGKTRGSIKDVRGPAANQSSVIARGAAVFLEAGTGRYGLRGRDYVITPKNGRFLHFRVQGRWVFASHVIHPGIKPTHFMQQAAESTRAHFVALCVGASHRAVAGH